jgi:acyl carrier protein
MTEPWLLPASYAQERIWFANQLAGDVPVYRVASGVRTGYPLRDEQIVEAVRQVVQRHESLRTSFRLVDGVLMQAVHADPALSIAHADLTGTPAGQIEQRHAEVRVRQLAEPLPLDRPPLWRVVLVKSGPHTDRVFFTLHHAIFDGASEVNLRAELAELFAAAAQGRPARLPDLPIQYADYTMWHRDRLAGGRLEELLEYWRKTLAGAPAVHRVPMDHPRPAQRTFRGASADFPIPSTVENDVATLARTRSATAFMVLVAAYAALLHRLSGENDIVVGVPVAGRDVPELQPLIGMFVNMVLLRIDVSGDPGFDELLTRVRATALAAWDHQDMPYQKLVEALATRRDPGVPPLYQLGFNHTPGGFDNDAGGAEDDLMLEITDGLARLQYNTALFEPETARRMAGDYLRLLTEAVSHPTTRLSDLPVTTPALPGSPAGASSPGVPSGAPWSGAPSPGQVGEMPPLGGLDGGGPGGYVAPRTDAEELVAQVWREILGVERVGVHDDFFDLGGHSLLALRVIARLSADTGIDVPIQDFFTDTTLQGVAALLERLLTEEIAGLSDEEAAAQLAEGATTPPQSGRPR